MKLLFLLCFLTNGYIPCLKFSAKLHKILRFFQKIHKNGCNFVTFWYNKKVKVTKL